MESDTSTNQSVGGPKFDLIGPTVDDDIRRIISRYGASAVADALKRQLTPPRGRKPEEDWPELRSVIDADAEDWLSGLDPFSSRSNYSIAKDFADRNPGHSHPGTMKRILRKLAQRRIWMALATAQHISYEKYSHTAHVRALTALCELDSHPAWVKIRDQANLRIAEYEAKLGTPPLPHMSMKEVEDASRNTPLALSAQKAPQFSGLLGGRLASYAAAQDKSG